MIRTRISLAVIATALSTFCVRAQGSEPDPGRKDPKFEYDCGTRALYSLMKLEGLSVDIEQLGSALPALQSSGHTMLELKNAAAKFGLRLSGVSLGNQLEGIDRPMIVFLRQNPHGHFMVLRPVGSMGTLVQILDPNRTPEIVDKSELLGSAEWTGLALIPQRSNWLLRAACAVAGCLALGFSLVRLKQSRAGRHKLPPLGFAG